MNKGHVYPQARSRWSIGAVGYDIAGPPCWVKISWDFQFIPDPTNPGVTVSVIQDPYLRRWSYQQSNGAVVWANDWTWTNPLYFGFVEFKQIPGNDVTPAIAQVKLGITYSGPFPYATVIFYQNFGDGIWRGFGGGFGNQFAKIGSWDARVFAYQINALQGQTYGNLRAAGKPDRDTSPLTWNY